MNELSIEVRDDASAVVVKRAVFAWEDVGDNPHVDWFFDNLGLISNPPPRLKDPTGLTGVGFDGLPWPHDVYASTDAATGNSIYRYPLEAACKYVFIDGTPEGFSFDKLVDGLKAIVAKHAVDDPRAPLENAPTITLVM